VQSTLFDLIPSSGRTCPEFFQRPITPLAASWVRLSAVMSPSYSSKDGRTRAWSMDPTGEQRGESWMPNTSAWPNDASVCSLSQILETGPIPPKYFLSGKACAGILRRAERRGKELPEQLRRALKAVADSERTLRLAVDSTHTQQRGGASISLTKSNIGKQCNNQMPLVPVAFQSNMGSHSGAYGIDICPTMITQKSGGGGMPAVAHDGSHANGGGQVAVITLAIRGRGDSSDLEIRTDGTANALLTPNGGRAGMGVGAVGYTIHGTDKTASVASEADVAGSIRTKPPGSQENSSTTVALSGMAVRRLTPEECEALQGFPSGYTNIPSAADGPRYKALGNSMAVPVMAWIGRRIKEAYAHPNPRPR